MNVWKASTFGFGAAFALSIAVPRVNSARAEEQPHMEAAHQLLKMAKEHLQLASNDKGGHRVKAMALISDAIAEVKAGIEFDNKR